jgi:hypothetical protein
MPMSAEEMNANGADISRKFTAFNWDKWQLSQGRDTEILACTDQAIKLPACRELGEDAADNANNCFKARARFTCCTSTKAQIMTLEGVQAMPPTSSYSWRMLTDADGCYRIVQAMPPTSSYSWRMLTYADGC